MSQFGDIGPPRAPVGTLYSLMLEQRRTAPAADWLIWNSCNSGDWKMPRLGALILASAGVIFAPPLRSAEVLLSCVWQSHGVSRQMRSFDVRFDQQTQRADLGGNESLPATISSSQVSFAVNRGGSIFFYAIDRLSGFGTISIKDQVVYSGTCKVGAAAARGS
jgi:hypothetical protein